MNKFQIFAFITSILMLSIGGVAMVYYYYNPIKDNLSNSVIETGINEMKVGPNTNMYLQTCYKYCNHNIIEKIDVKPYMNFTLEELTKEYDIVQNNENGLVINKQENSYCGYHYTLKTVDKKIGIYNRVTDQNDLLYDVIDVNVDTLRDNDKFLFIDTGIDIYGNENLSRVIEDFNS